MWLCSSSTSIIEDRDLSAHLNILTIRPSIEMIDSSQRTAVAGEPITLSVEVSDDGYPIPRARRARPAASSPESKRDAATNIFRPQDPPESGGGKAGSWSQARRNVDSVPGRPWKRCIRSHAGAGGERRNGRLGQSRPADRQSRGDVQRTGNLHVAGLR